MKKLFYLFIVFTILACSTDDDNGNTLTITVDETTPTTATIQWTVPSASDGQTIKYQILLNGTELENNYSSRTYTFTNLQFESDYNVAVYALDNSGNSTFSEISFTTLRNPVGGNIILSNQTDIENFDYEEINSLTLVGEGVTDVSSLSILRSVRGNITISSTSLTSLEGLENIVNPNPPDFSNYPELNIRNNNLLENINALSSYTGGIRKLIITNNPQLNALSNLEINDFMRELTLIDIPATNFSNFSTLEIINNITLENIPPNVLTGFTSLSIVQDKFEIINIDFQNLNALGNLNNLYILEITNATNINSLSGIGDSQYIFNYFLTGQISPPNVDFLNDLPFSNVSIIDTNLTNLDAFEDVSSITRLKLIDNANLTNISGLSGLTSIYDLSINNNLILNNLSGLGGFTTMNNISINNNPNLNNLSGLNNITNVRGLSLHNTPNITNLGGLDSLQQIDNISISNCDALISLEGTNLAASNNASVTGVYINDNPLLSDFCALQPYFQAGGIASYDNGWEGGGYYFGVSGNLYNPSIEQIVSPTGCSN